MKRKLLGFLALMMLTYFNSGVLFAQETKSVSGQVLDEGAEPIPGVNVLIVGTSTGTVTDLDGYFQLPAVPQGAMLSFSFIGFQTQEVAVGAQSELNITLLEDIGILNEVVVVGFGEQKKANLTGAVTTVDSRVLESRPVQNVGQMLQGVVPGLNLQTSGLGGELNQNLSFNIRGQEPLVPVRIRLRWF